MMAGRLVDSTRLADFVPHNKMNIFLVMIFGCIGGGAYAIVKKSLPIGPRRKVIDTPAVRLGMVLILLPFANAAFLLTLRWIAISAFASSPLIKHWSMIAPLVVFPLSIAGCLAGAKRWSVPTYYAGKWSEYVPYQRKNAGADMSFLGTNNQQLENGK